MLHTSLKQPDRLFSLAGSILPLRSLRLSTQAAVQPDIEADGTKGNLPKPYRTNVDSPSKHKAHHVAKFYTVPKHLEDGLFQMFNLTKASRQFNSLVGEMAIMVREPFLEIKDCIETYDYSQPALRLMLYGKLGAGKNYTMAHLVHYGLEKDWLLVTHPFMPEWLKRPKGLQPSPEDPKIMESPVEAAVWLQHFRSINARLLEKLQLRTTNNWKFTGTEKVAKGEPLSNLIAHGIDRMKHSNLCVRGVLHEIKAQTDSGNLKTMVIIGGVNCLWEMSYEKDNRKQFIPAKNFHLLQSFQEILKRDWKNAAIVVSVSTSALLLKHHNLDHESVPSFMPQYLLGKEGFEFFEPFLPIRVEKYSPKEIESVLDYYIDMNYIQHHSGRTASARDELKFLSGGNPRTLRGLCGWI